MSATHDEGRAVEDRLLPPAGTGVPSSRRWAGSVVAVVGLPLLTLALVSGRESLSLGTMLLLYLLVVVVVAVVGGTWPAVLAAVASSLLANWYLTPPYHTLVVDQRDSLVSLAVFVVVALLVSVTVEVAASRRAAASRSAVEAELLSRYTAEPLGEGSLPAVLESVRVIFGMETVALLDATSEGVEVARVGPPMQGNPAISHPIDGGLQLVAAGPDLFAEDRRLLGRLADTAARAYEGQRLAEEAGRARELAQIDVVRAALLAAVGHDLRTPLSGIKAAVSSLRQADMSWTPDEAAELLATIESSADRLDELIGNLLAMSRLQAGAVSVVLEPVALDGVVAQALLDLGGFPVVVDVADDLPFVLADAGLLERVVANLVSNAHRFTPSDATVEIRARPDGAGSVQLAVIDHGVGVTPKEWPDMFVPFQRLDDHSSGGVGLGLAIARGFTEAMHGTLVPSTTPGGGLTMTATLRCAP